MRRFILIAVLLCLAALAVGCASSARAQDGSVGAALRSLAARSGMVFVGRATAITPLQGSVEIRFAVEQPVLGVTGATYTLREWAGLWVGGQPRYRLGQRAMFFLHAPSAAGLSTPVDGMEGIVPVVATAANQPLLLDVRRLATRVQRAPGTPLDTAEKGAVALSEAASAVAAWKTVSVEPKRLPLPVALEPR
jgi:hypothetical protein